MLETVKELVKRKLGMDHKGRCIRSVLDAFKAMGADSEELKREKNRLTQDEMYLAEWHVAVNPPRRFSSEVEAYEAASVHSKVPHR